MATANLSIPDRMALFMSEVEPLITIFKTIERLGEADDVIGGLALHGQYLAEALHNEIDVIREELDTAKKGGAA